MVAYPQIPELAERGRGKLEQFFRRIDDQLADNEFIAGDRFSIADIAAVVVVDFSSWIKLSVPEDAENIQRWYKAVSARPSVAA
jgi:glutathione S-transferase